MHIIPSSTKARVAAGVVAAAVLVPTAANAVVAGFNDVPDGHAHAEGIQWVADNGITAGCTTDEYCPSAPVTRAQMATFMQRLAGHAAGIAPSVDADTIDGLDSTELVGPPGPAGPAGPAGPPGPAGGVNPFDAATGTAPFTTTAAPWVNVTGASTTVTIPAGTGSVVATFSAESACYGGGGWCTARILVDGNPMTPTSGTDFAFDSTDNNTETFGSWESHSFQQVVTGLPAGNHTFQVQVGIAGAGSTFRLDDWSLTTVGYLD